MDAKEMVGMLEKFPELMQEIYGDLFKPGVSEVGKAIGGIIGLGNTALMPVHLVNQKSKMLLASNLEKYRIELAKLEPGDVVAVPAEVGVPVLEKLSYVNNDELSSLYVNLLTKASSLSESSQAHPSFVNLISSLSPDEAGFLQVLRRKQSIPFIEVMISCEVKSERIRLEDYVVHSSVVTDLTFKQNFPSYLSNLESLGILTIRRDISLVPTEEHYGPIWDEHKEKYSIAYPPSTVDGVVMYEKAQIDITPFGCLFISACSTKLPNS